MSYLINQKEILINNRMSLKSEALFNQIVLSQQSNVQRLFSQLCRLEISQIIIFFQKIKNFINQPPAQSNSQRSTLLDKKYMFLRLLGQIILSGQYSFYIILTIEIFPFLVSLYRSSQISTHSKKGLMTVKSQANISNCKQDHKMVQTINSRSRILIKQILQIFGCSSFKFHPFSQYQFDSRLAYDIQTFIPTFIDAKQELNTKNPASNKRKFICPEQLAKYQLQRKKLKKGFIWSSDYKKMNGFLAQLVQSCFLPNKMQEKQAIQSTKKSNLLLIRKIILSRDSSSIKTIVHSVSKFIPNQLPKVKSDLQIYFSNAIAAIEVVDCIIKSCEIQAIEQTKVACLKRFLSLLFQIIKYTKKTIQTSSYRQGISSVKSFEVIPKDLMQENQQIRYKAKNSRKLIIDRVIFWSWATKKVGLQQFFYSNILKAIYGDKQYARARHQTQKKQFETQLLRLLKTNQQKKCFVKRKDKQTMRYQDHQIIKKLQQEIMNYSQTVTLRSESTLLKEGLSDFRSRNFRQQSQQEVSFNVSSSNNQCSFNSPSENQFAGIQTLRGPQKKFTSYCDFSSKSNIKSEQVLNLQKQGKLKRQVQLKQQQYPRKVFELEISQYSSKHPSHRSKQRMVQVGVNSKIFYNQQQKWNLKVANQQQTPISQKQSSVVFFSTSKQQQSIDKERQRKSSNTILKNSSKKSIKIKQTSLKRSKSGYEVTPFSRLSLSQMHKQQQIQSYDFHDGKTVKLIQQEYGLSIKMRQEVQWNYPINLSGKVKKQFNLSQPQIIQFEDSRLQQNCRMISNSSIIGQCSTTSSAVRDKQFGNNAKIPKSQRKPKFAFINQQKIVQSGENTYNIGQNSKNGQKKVFKGDYSQFILVEDSLIDPDEYYFDPNKHLLNDSCDLSILSSNLKNNVSSKSVQKKLNMNQKIIDKTIRNQTYSQQKNPRLLDQKLIRKENQENSFSRFSQMIRNQKKNITGEQIFTFKQIQKALSNKNNSHLQAQLIRAQIQILRNSQATNLQKLEEQLGELKQQNSVLFNAIKNRIHFESNQIKYSQYSNDKDILKQENSILMALLKMKLQREQDQKNKGFCFHTSSKNNLPDKLSSLSCIIMQSKCFSIQNVQLVDLVPQKISRKVKKNLRSQKGLIIKNQFIQMGYTKNKVKSVNTTNSIFITIFITFLKPFRTAKLEIQSASSPFDILNREQISLVFNSEQFPVGNQSKFTLKLQQSQLKRTYSNLVKITVQIFSQKQAAQKNQSQKHEGFIPVSICHFMQFTKQQHSEQWINSKRSQLHKFYCSPWFKVSSQIQKHCIKNDIKGLGDLLRQYFGQFEDQTIENRYYQYYSCCKRTDGSIILFRINVDMDKLQARVELLDKSCKQVMQELVRIVCEQQS